VTHILRSAEFELRIELQDLIRNKLDLPAIPSIEFGRINVTGALTQGRDIRAKIESGEYSGWDDPRLVTIKTLRRRGIVPASFRELIYDLGFGTGQANLDFSMIAAINRKIVDPTTPRRFFVADPVAIVVDKAPAKEAHLPVHPQNPDMGTRTLTVKAGQTVFITTEDSKRKDKLLRLMDYCNITRKGNKDTSFVFDSPDIETFREKGGAIIHWLPDDQTVPCEIMMPDATVVKGVAEASIKDFKVGSLVQFERFGFCRLDAIEKAEGSASKGGKKATTASPGNAPTYKFWFTHK
jgi:glutamyl-tRNA synthetase